LGELQLEERRCAGRGCRGWLHRRQEDWATAGLPWEACCRAWATQKVLHTGQTIIRALDAWFDRGLCAYGPYFFADLLDTTEADEQAAIGAGQIQATGIRYTGVQR
jgi:hypothetical protein